VGLATFSNNVFIAGDNTNTGYSRYLKLYGNSDPSTNVDRWAGLAVYNNGGNNVNELAFFTGSGDSSRTERMRITSAGNVGIGTTMNINKLDVAGNINVQGGNGSYLTFNNGDANIVINNNGSGRDLSFKTYDGSSNSERMRIDKDGNVGIGITSPQAKLHVDGKGIISSNKYGDYATGGLDTTGVVVATITGSGNGASASIEFVGMGGVNGIVDVVYNCTNQGGNWYVYKNERQTASTVDVVATGNGTATLTFTFKAISSSQGYTPRLRMIGSPYNLITF
jgi:hypothetical protein